MRRVRCSRNCLRKSVKIVNMLVTVCGVGMIIYSLWLGKKWDQGVSELSISSRTSLSRPWFIMVCLGTGMAVCLSTLCGQGVANWGSKSQLKEYIDDEHASFKSFIIFHLYMCRLISIMALVAQTNVVLLAIVLWVVGTEPVRPQGILDVPDFKHSFLISPNSPVDDDDDLRNRSQVDFVLRTRPIENYL
ncbi:Tetraspanin-19-like protein [Drosera capensis]